MLTMLAGRAAWAEPEIVWRVENAFRFFHDPADTEVHRATWKSLTPEQAVNPIQSAEILLSDRHPDGGWAATMYDKTCWDPRRNTLRLPAAEGLSQPQEPRGARKPERARRRDHR